MSNESFLIKTIGGPFDGETRIVPHSVLGWPPPMNLPGVFHGGIYIRANFSKLPEINEGSLVMRGADYKWTPHTKGEDIFST